MTPNKQLLSAQPKSQNSRSSESSASSEKSSSGSSSNDNGDGSRVTSNSSESSYNSSSSSNESSSNYEGERTYYGSNSNDTDAIIDGSLTSHEGYSSDSEDVAKNAYLQKNGGDNDASNADTIEEEPERPRELFTNSIEILTKAFESASTEEPRSISEKVQEFVQTLQATDNHCNSQDAGIVAFVVRQSNRDMQSIGCDVRQIKELEKTRKQAMKNVLAVLTNSSFLPKVLVALFVQLSENWTSWALLSMQSRFRLLRTATGLASKRKKVFNQEVKILISCSGSPNIVRNYLDCACHGFLDRLHTTRMVMQLSIPRSLPQRNPRLQLPRHQQTEQEAGVSFLGET